ncbi:rhamnosyltransferase [Selenomonas sp. GACV-9]|uniref:glycosyltransferase family 2 protein n=1 Tax=Selenomonas sp. GACV-9 TaxID=3158782 RepID=UPI0008E7A89B|nr:rhamnosyltransferase [Selenomonas ruminantium]
MEILVIIPVYNPDEKFERLLDMLQRQSIGCFPVLLIDSGSQHDYQNVIKNNRNFMIRQIANRDFNHGGTRQLGIKMYPDKDVYVFLTQDAILADEMALEHLLKCFTDKTIGCAYGRQLPHKDASWFSRIARLNNYGEKSYVRSFNDRMNFGMKTCFISNSYAAYRKEAMNDIDGFPNNTILSEDMFVAAKMLINGWKVAYDADSKVYHSHNYSILQEFKRYFDIGVFHSRESWIREIFGQAEGEGLNFMKRELQAIIRNNPFLLAEMIARDSMKFIGYRLGLYEKKIPIGIKRHISMMKRYWESE